MKYIRDAIKIFFWPSKFSTLGLPKLRFHGIDFGINEYYLKLKSKWNHDRNFS